ncbi:regucalcin-like [Saccostrea cucullata]|uniref:regucalcin-like n=1 Tax=Saccostrea cuccullata TaxID=36930 RepID=UPI002ED18F80
MAVECVIKNATKTIGEGPHWDELTSTLLYLDIHENSIHRLNPETNVADKIKLEDTVGFVVPARKGGLIAGVGCFLVHVNWDTKKVTKLHEVDKETRFNDGKCNPKGRVWTGTYGAIDPDVENMPKIGSLYCLDLDGNYNINQFSYQNDGYWGLSLYMLLNLRFLFVANQKVIVDNAGKPLPDFGFPDGMTIDTEGKLWVACFLASKVVRYDPQTGQQLHTVKFPALRITSCCFGGKNLDELYVTCSAHEVSEEEFQKYPLTGSVFKVKGLGVKGSKAQIYEGEIKEG